MRYDKRRSSVLLDSAWHLDVDAQLQKIPYMLVVGDKEEAANAVSVRLRTNVDLKSIPVTELITRVSEIAKTKSMDL